MCNYADSPSTTTHGTRQVHLCARTTTSTTTVAKTGPTSTPATCVPLPSPRTTTSTTPVNVYFPRRLEPLRKCTLRRYNPETPSVDRMHVLYEMHPMFAPCPFASCTFLLVRHADEPWEPGNRDHPTISSMFRTSARLLLHRYLRELPEPICCRGIIFGYVAVASFSDMLPWHHFCFAAVAPFLFRHGDQMLHNMLMSTFS